MIRNLILETEQKSRLRRNEQKLGIQFFFCLLVLKASRGRSQFYLQDTSYCTFLMWCLQPATSIGKKLMLPTAKWLTNLNSIFPLLVIGFWRTGVLRISRDVWKEYACDLTTQWVSFSARSAGLYRRRNRLGFRPSHGGDSKLKAELLSAGQYSTFGWFSWDHQDENMM